MKMKSYRATDMRQALALVRDAQGPDAVILSSKRVAGGVEVVAAVDYDVEDATPSAAEYSFMPPERGTLDDDIDGYEQRAARQHTQAAKPTARPSTPARAPRPEPRVPAALAEPETSPSMSDELRTLRQMLETQMATLAWNDLSRRAPLQTELLKVLSELGLASDLSGELVAQLPAKLEFAEAQRLAFAQLARRVVTVEERWLEHGGMVAVVGPTGVGKTTLIAKLAARWVMRHGPRSLALISADAVRIGAQEQIHTLGRLLGVPAYGIDGVNELAPLLDHLADRRLVLIDTAGLSQRDERLRGELATLAAAHPKLETSLVLSGAAQAGAIEETVVRFAAAEPSSCVLTKLDEATSLGGAISTLIRSRLPLAYLSDGQRVPEDLSAARAHQLIARAVQLSHKSGATADEDLLQRRFGAVAHVMA